MPGSLPGEDTAANETGEQSPTFRELPVWLQKTGGWVDLVLGCGLLPLSTEGQRRPGRECRSFPCPGTGVACFRKIVEVRVAGDE